jgi:hypothetical protein
MALPVKICGAAVIADAEVATVQGKVDTVDALQILVESGKVGENRPGVKGIKLFLFFVVAIAK